MRWTSALEAFIKRGTLRSPVPLQWNAELSRAAGDSKPDAWDTATAAWLELSRPHRAAYTMLRHAEALLGQRGRGPAVGDLLRTAARLAAEHIPLHRAITELVTRARVHLSPPAPTDSAATPAAAPPPTRTG